MATRPKPRTERRADLVEAARRAMLELGDWQWATARATLAQVANPSSIWAYAYATPADCINAMRILRPTASTNGISYTCSAGIKWSSCT